MEEQKFISGMKNNAEVNAGLEETIFDSPEAKGIRQIEEELYQPGEIPDSFVVQQIYEVKKRMELFDKKRALENWKIGDVPEKKKTIPNFVIMGGPGSGKTTLAKRLAAYLGSACGKRANVIGSVQRQWILVKSASDLKGTHVGQTAERVYNMLVNAAKNKQIIFIDEAYHLQNDEFGREAVDMLLPLLSGDRDVIEKAADGQVISYSFSEHGTDVPPIWFGGYEHEMRKMLSENPGLYRRMIKLALSTPGVKELFRNLCMLSKDNKDCLTVFQDNEKEIKDYFSWGMRPEYVDYFSSYAGVRSMYETAEVYLSRSMEKSQARKLLHRMIEEKKAEIKKQYKAVLTDIKSAEFEIETDITATLEDRIGNRETVDTLRSIIECLYRNANRQEIADAPKGVLFTGPSGTGKTSLARAVAGEIQLRFEQNIEQNLKVAFISTVASELRESGKMKRLFEEAEEYDVCIIFIDELDAIGRKRDMPGARPELLYQLLKEMDGVEARKNVFVIGATNDPRILDPALLRPGRLERFLELSLPNMEERILLLRKYIMELPFLQEALQEEKNRAEVEQYLTGHALLLMGYSQADMKGLVNRAAMECMGKLSDIHRYDNSIVTFYRHIFAMLIVKNFQLKTPVNYQKVAFYEERYEEVSALAVHQLGHYVVNESFSVRKDTEKVSILFRDDSFAYMDWWREYTPTDREKLLRQIQISLGGCLFEELFYGEALSVRAMEDWKLAEQYAERQLELFGPWDGMEEAGQIVREQLYRLGNEMRRKGQKKELFLLTAKLLHEKERISKSELRKSLENAKKANASYQKRNSQDQWLERVEKYNETVAGTGRSKKPERVLHLDSDGYRHKMVKHALKGCGAVIVDYVRDMDGAVERLEAAAQQGTPYDLIVMEPEKRYWDSFDAGNYTGLLRQLEEHQIMVPVLICGMFDLYVRSETGVVWYIRDRDMTQDFQREISKKAL